MLCRKESDRSVPGPIVSTFSDQIIGLSYGWLNKLSNVASLRVPLTRFFQLKFVLYIYPMDSHTNTYTYSQERATLCRKYRLLGAMDECYEHYLHPRFSQFAKPHNTHIYLCVCVRFEFDLWPRKRTRKPKIIRTIRSNEWDSDWSERIVRFVRFVCWIRRTNELEPLVVLKRSFSLFTLLITTQQLFSWNGRTKRRPLCFTAERSAPFC